MLEELFGWNSARIRLFFEAHGLTLQEWDKIRTDSITLSHAAAEPAFNAGVD
jgi:hypothetical protein